MAQLVKCLTSAQVMISQSVGLNPASGSVLTAQSLEPASDSVSLSLSSPTTHTLCLFLSKLNKTFLKIKINKKLHKPMSDANPLVDRVEIY